MGFRRVRPGEDPSIGGSTVVERLRREGGAPRTWANGPDAVYSWHAHGSAKVLYCLEGSVTFHGRDGSAVDLAPGDRLEIDAGTHHAATVGPGGVRCVEVFRRADGHDDAGAGEAPAKPDPTDGSEG